MPFFRTPQKLIIAFLVLSFLLYLALPRHSNHHQLRYPLDKIQAISLQAEKTPLHDLFISPSNRSFPTPSLYSRDRRGAIEIFENNNRIICRVYRTCRFPNGVVHLPRWMKPHAHLLHTQCGISAIVFSKLASIKNPFWIKEYDLIAPNIPLEQLHIFLKSYLPSFFVTTNATKNPFGSTGTHRMKRKCISPWSLEKRLYSKICRNKPEGHISYPAIILNTNRFEYEVREQLAHLLNDVFHSLFAVNIRVINTTDPVMTTGKLCFRSIITSPLTDIIPTSERSLSIHGSGGIEESHDAASVLGHRYMRIGSGLQQITKQPSQGMKNSNGSIAKETIPNKRGPDLMSNLTENTPSSNGNNGSTQRLPDGNLSTTAGSNSSTPERTANRTIKLFEVTRNTPEGTETLIASVKSVNETSARILAENKSEKRSLSNTTIEIRVRNASRTPDESHDVETVDESTDKNTTGDYLPTFQSLLDHPPENE